MHITCNLFRKSLNLKILNNVSKLNISCIGLPQRTLHTQILRFQNSNQEPDQLINPYSLPGFGQFGGDTPTDRLRNFNIVATEGFKNYCLFALYSELLASYLYPHITQWVIEGMGCMSSVYKAKNDIDFCNKIMTMWQIQPPYSEVSPPYPPSLKAYNTVLYRIRLVAAKEQIAAAMEEEEVFEIDYDLIKDPYMKAPPSLEILIEFIRMFPWQKLVQKNHQDYHAIKGLFNQSTDYFKYAYQHYISNNANNFTIDHDTVGRFWFNQDCLFKCLFHLSTMTIDGIDFPLDKYTAEYLRVFRVVSLESGDIISNLLIDPKSRHYKILSGNP